MMGLSKCCGAWARPMVEWTGKDYKRTEDGWILIVEYQCQKCHKPCEIKLEKTESHKIMSTREMR